MDKANNHGGHRRRLIEKMQKGPLLEHEYLEILLFNALPRQNTNDLAHRLISEFGSVEDLFLASMEELCAVKGVGESLASYLTVIGKFYRRYFRKTLHPYSGKYEPMRFKEYLEGAYKFFPTEHLDVYFLDSDSNIIQEYQFDGDKASVSLETEQLIQLIITANPSGLVLAHNHPDGGIQPSAKDEELTKKCQIICSAHNIMFCDHLIYGQEGVYSYYLSGRLKEISHQYAVSNLVKGE